MRSDDSWLGDFFKFANSAFRIFKCHERMKLQFV